MAAILLNKDDLPETRVPDQDEQEPDLGPVYNWQTAQAKRLAEIKIAEGHEISRFAPQPGKQWMAAACSADILVYGGAAFGGKSFLILLDALRHVRNGMARTVVFRRTYSQIFQPGGLWDVAAEIYPKFGGVSRESQVDYTFESGYKIKFAHLQHEKDRYTWQGAQGDVWLYDEGTHFTEDQVFYTGISRGRSRSGMRPYVRITCNPDPNSWLRRWVDWWIGPDGWPDPERDGVIRYFVKEGDTVVWGDSPEEIMRKMPGIKPVRIKSFCFISSTIYDNKIGMSLDPAYEGNIDALSYVERMRLKGNWNIKAGGGNFFREKYFRIIDNLPDLRLVIRHWDMAATEPTPENPDPDWLCGTLMGITKNFDLVIIDRIKERVTPGRVDAIIQRAAEQDFQQFRHRYSVGIEQEPGSSGKKEAERYVRMLRQKVWVHRPDQSKEVRARALSAHAEHCSILVMRGHWNDDYIKELCAFPDAAHDDQVDSSTGGFQYFQENKGRDLSGY